MDFLKDQKISIIIIFLNIVFLIFTFGQCYLILDIHYEFIVALFLIGTAIFWFYQEILRKVLYKILFTIGAFGAVIATYYGNVKVVTDFINNQIIYNFNTINELIYKSKETYFFLYKPMFSILIPIGVTIILLISAKGWENSVIFVTYTFMLMLWYTGFHAELKPCLLVYVFISIFTFGVNSYLKNRRKLNRRGIRVAIEHRFIILYALIISLILTSVISISPQKFKGKGNLSLQNKIENAFSTETVLGKEEKEKREKESGMELLYDISYSGYDSGSGRLGGPITLNFEEVFKVKSDKPYYLRGIAKDFYNGSSWEKTKKDFKKLEKDKNNIESYTMATDYLDGENSLTIYPTGLKTSTFFAPNYTFKANSEKGNIYYDDIPTLMSNDYIEDPYTVKFYNIDENADVISIHNIPLGAAIPRQYYQQKYPEYLQVPDNVNDQYSELVLNIVKDCTTNYEKVQKIKEYLSKNYKYSLDVGEVPEGRDFIDYFLNVEKKGYCTYFATTTTIFCRIAGVPARYVEGFHMSDKKDSKGNYIVGNDDAHAWTEVLLLSSTNRGLWCTVDCVPNVSEEIKRVKDLQSKPTTNDPSKPNKPTSKKPELEDPTAADIKTSNEKSPVMSTVYLSAAGIAALMLIFAAIMHLIFIIRKNKFMKANSAIPAYIYALKRLSKVGIKKSQDVADREFIEHIADKEVKKALREIVTLCYEEYYGGKLTKDFDRIQFYKEIEKFIRKKQSRFKYYIRKYYF